MRGRLLLKSSMLYVSFFTCISVQVQKASSCTSVWGIVGVIYKVLQFSSKWKISLVKKSSYKRTAHNLYTIQDSVYILSLIFPLGYGFM
jgi:hypothetical protein